MGLAVFTESDAQPQSPPILPPDVDAPVEHAAELDAFAKGK